MTPAQLQYVREWRRDGNNYRFATRVEDSIVGHETSGVEDELPQYAWEMLDRDEDTFCQLSPAGLLIAKLANALEEANETVEYLRACTTFESQRSFREGSALIAAARANLKELLGR